MNTLKEFEGKRLIVTGASSGIGYKISSDLASSGATILALGRNSEKLESLKKISPNNIEIELLDVTDFTQLRVVVNKFVEKGRIDGCVHSAGINKFTPLRAFNWTVFDKIMKVNVHTGIELVRLISSKKNSNEGCSIVMIASVAALKGEVGFTAYSASKGALISAVRCMALELASSKIRINAISPGVVQTELTDTMANFYPNGMDAVINKHPLGIGSVEDISNLAMFLLSDKSKWVTGSNYVIDGGYSIN